MNPEWAILKMGWEGQVGTGDGIFFFSTDHCGSTNYLLLYWVQRYGSNQNSPDVWLSDAHFPVTSSVSGGKGCRGWHE